MEWRESMKRALASYVEQQSDAMKGEGGYAMKVVDEGKVILAAYNGGLELPGRHSRTRSQVGEHETNPLGEHI